MTPVLEHVPFVNPSIKRLPTIRAEPREHRKVMGPGQHVHRIDLEQPDPPDYPREVTNVNPTGRSFTQALYPEKYTDRLVVREPGSPFCHYLFRVMLNPRLTVIDQALWVSYNRW